MTHYYLLIAHGARLLFSGKSTVVDTKIYRTREAAERALPAFKAYVCADDDTKVFSALDPSGLRIGVVEQEFVDE